MALPSLNQLSDREKALLRLLGQGHTVKTAAATTDDSVHAANELLRSARRKLGVASSREAARLLASAERLTQENCDRKIGIEQPPPIVARQAYAILGAVIGGIMLVAFLALFIVAASPNGGTQAAPQPEPVSDIAGSEKQGPLIVETFPAHGSQIEPGPFELRVTFDRPMEDQFSILSLDIVKGQHLNCIGTGGPRQSQDKRSFNIPCEAEAGAQYTLALGDIENGYFRDTDWNPAKPFVLSFTVAPLPPVGKAEVGL